MNIVGAVRFFIQDHIMYARRTGIEFLIYAFLQVLMALTLYYGFFLILPQVCGTCSVPVLTVLYVWGIWIYVAIQANLLLIRIRNSSIYGRILIPPKAEVDYQENPTNHHSSGDSDGESHQRNLTNDLRHLAQQFTNRPYDSDSAWHICAACEVFVPPRTWHCNTCQTCVIRRDHHCVFAMQCIGEDNHCNFLGLLFYLSCGTLYASIFGYIRMVQIDGVEWYWWLFKCIIALYTVFFDRTIIHIVMSVNFTGWGAATGIFTYYFMLALRGQTSADNSRRIRRTLPGVSRYSLKNLKSFLGSNYLYKIVWPFHKVTVTQYSSQGDGSTKHL